MNPLSWGSLRLTSWVVAALATLVMLSLNGQAPQSGKAPALHAIRFNDVSVEIVWPASAQLFQLESTIALESPFQAVPQPAVQVNDQWHVRLPATPGARFFRLHLPVLTRIAESSPANGDDGVAVTRETILRFTAPLHPNTLLSSNNFHAEAAGRQILTRAEIGTDRRSATLFYLEPLPGATRVTVTFDAHGIFDEVGLELDGDGDGKAGGQGIIRFDSLGLAPTPKTSVFGRVFASELIPNGAGLSMNRPLAGVTISVDGAEESLRTITDANGDFLLEPVPAGDFFVHIDGRTSPLSSFPEGAYYPFVGKKWTAIAGRSVSTSGTGEIYLPLIPKGALQRVSATEATSITFPAEMIAANPSLQGVSVMVPPNSLYSDDGTRGGRVGIAPVAPDRLPSPLPPGLNFPVVITVQTDGPQNFAEPAPVCFPNLPDPLTGKLLQPGEKSAIWSFNHDLGDWEVVGPATVSADGRLICSDPGVGIRQPGWHGSNPGTPTGSGGGGGAASSTPPDPCDWPSLQKYFDDEYIRLKSSANVVLAHQLSCLARKACANQSTWGGGFIKSVMCAEKSNPNGVPVFIQGMQISDLCSVLPADLQLGVLSTTQLCSVLSGFGHHFFNELLPYFIRYCSQINAADHNHLFDDAVIPCFDDLVAAGELDSLSAAIGKATVPIGAAALRKIAEFACKTHLGQAAGAHLAAVEAPQPLEMPTPEELTLPVLKGLGDLRCDGNGTFFLRPGDVIQLRVQQTLADASVVDLAAQTNTQYFAMVDSGLLKFEDGGILRVLDTPVKLVTLPTRCDVLVVNGTNFGFAQFAFTDFDTDGDGIGDAAERRAGTDPTSPNGPGSDLDGDGVSDRDEILIGTNPRNPDTDGDGFLDGVEIAAGIDPLNSGLDSAPPVLRPQRFLIEDLASGLVFRGSTSQQGKLPGLILAPIRKYRITILDPETLGIGSADFTSSRSGFRTLIPPVLLQSPAGPDTDHDGLIDLAERVIGTDPAKADTDGDGINDLAELRQGTDPIDGDPPTTGVIRVTRTPGATPQDVAAFNHLAAVADRESGLSLFNIFNGLTPTLIGRLNTQGPATAVALDRDFAAVAEGEMGLGYFALTELTNLTTTRNINFGASVQCVALAGNIAFVGLASGRVVEADLDTGSVLAETTFRSPVEDLAIAGDFLYALTQQGLAAIQIADGEFRVTGYVGPEFERRSFENRRRLALGNGFAFSTFPRGYVVHDLANPAQPVWVFKQSTGQFAWRQLVPNGAGLGLALADQAGVQINGQDLSLYDLRAPASSIPFLASLPTPGDSRALSLFNGLAYIADDGIGLSVLNFRDYDRAGVAPSIRLSTSASGAAISASKLLRLTADVADDVQVRNVEFYIDGRLEATDGNLPFEYRFRAPALSEGRPQLTVRAKVTDTGGNSTWSELITLRIIADATPPKVRRLDPADNTIRMTDEVSRVTVIFDDPLDQATIAAGVFRLFAAGPDGVSGTVDDVEISPVGLDYQRDGNSLSLIFATPLKTEHYRAVIGQTLHNASGVALENEVAWVFRIKEPNRWIRRSDGAWEDPLNWSDREVPVAGDLVVIDPPNHNLVVRFAQPFSDIRSIRCTAGLDVAGGRLRVESDSVIAHLILSGGILMPTGQLDVATRLDWTSGTLEADDALTDPGTGSLNLLAGTTGEISRGPGGAHITRSVLNNAGTLVVSGRLLIDKEPVINNLSTGRLEFAADDALMFNAFGGGGITVNNTGILRKTGGTNEAGLLIKGKLNNSGRIEVLSGNLALGDSSISGPVDLEVDTYISFFGNVIIQPGTAFTGRGQPRLFGQLTLQADFEIANISLAFGTLTGPGRLTIIGDSEWNQATITGDGVVEVAPSGRLNIAPGFALAGLLDGRTVNNRGTIRVFKTFYGINGATINNLAEGRVELIGDVGFTVPSFGGNTQIGRPRPAAAVPGAPAGFNNFGTLVKTAGSGASRWEGVILSNAGLIDLSFGSLEILRRSDSISDRVINPLGDAPRSGARPAAPGDRMFLQTDAGQITFAIHGTNGPTEFGRLRVEDTADLGGGVRARFTKGVIPAVGQAFPVLEFGARNGDFSHLVLESTPSTGLKLERFFELQSMRLEVRAKP